MGLFKKKKRSESNNPAATIVKANIQDVQETAATNVALTNARISQDEVNTALSRLCNDESLYVDMKKAAVKNDRTIADAKAEKKAGGENEEKIKDLLEIEEGLYITSDELDEYTIGFRNISKEFDKKSSVDAVKTGADRINVHTMRYINSLEDALRFGKKLKAKCCFDMLRYILKVGYRVEDIADPNVLEKRIEAKVEVVKTLGDDLIKTIDEYYENIKAYNLDEQHYAKLYKQQMKDLEIIDEIPDNIQSQIDSLGFEGARALPSNCEARKYLPRLLGLAYNSSQLRGMALEMDARIAALVKLQSDIKERLHEFTVEFNKSGADFDYEEHNRRMEELHDKNAAVINSMNDMSALAYKMNQKYDSMLSAAGNHAGMKNTFSDVMKKARNLKKSGIENEQQKKQIAKQRAANAKAKQEREAQKQDIDMSEESMNEEPPEEVLTEI